MNGMVSALFERLEKSGIRYVLLRNYEQLCDGSEADATQATDIDLVIATEDIPAWREIAISLAEDLGWDALTECNHFTQSRRPEHHIEIFRFYSHRNRRFLQVDLFHSYLVWGLPFMTERELLSGRVYDAGRGLTRIDPFEENTFRLLQIQGLIGSKHCAPKIARYRDRVLRFDAEYREDFRKFLDRRFAGGQSGCAARILDALEREDWACYRKAVRRSKAAFWIGFARRHPLQAAHFLLERLLESKRRYWERPCGRTVQVYAETSRARGRFTDTLDELKHLNFFDQWVGRGPGSWLGKDALIIREQGGLLIEWTASDAADLIVKSETTKETISLQIVDLLVRQHAALFIREAADKLHAGPERLVEV